MKDHPLYPRQDAQALGRYYLAHVAGMTEADLYDKSDLCEQLAWRDKRIAELESWKTEQIEMGARWPAALERCAAMLGLPVGTSLADDVPNAVARAVDRLAALSRIVRRALASHQLEKLEDARPYLDELETETATAPKPYCACSSPGCEVCHP